MSRPERRRLFYCDHYSIPLPPGHPFPADKYGRLRETLAAEGDFVLEPAAPAPAEVVELAHDRDYVRAFLEGSLEPAALRRIGFPWSTALVQRSLASIGGTLAAAEQALAFGLGGNLAGGTHHASRAAGAGFCVFNDMAVAICWLRATARARRIAVVDLDVHQGDGTALFFAQDPGVLTLSLHGRNNFPFRKQQSHIDVDFPDGTGDEAYLAALDAVLPRVAAFAPELVFYQSGVDGLEADRLGRLSLTAAGLAERDRRVLTACREHGFPVVITLGGGYARPIEASVQAHATTYRLAARILGGRGRPIARADRER